jgi:hypothetical protein
LLFSHASGITINIHRNMGVLNARSRTYSAAICVQIRSDSLQPSLSYPQQGDSRATKASYHSVHTQRLLDLAQITTFAASRISENCVLVVENVDLNWCLALGLAFGIDHTFFAEHTSNPPGNTLWLAIIGDWSGNRRKPSQNGQMPTLSTSHDDAAEGFRDRWHIDGLLEYIPFGNGQYTQSKPTSTNFVRRTISYSKGYGWSSGTRVSYIPAKPNLCRS